MSDDQGDDEVGYGKPPRKHQFKPGESGNPKGRRKGSKGLKTELTEELNERVAITVEGKRINVSKKRLIIKALAAKAAKGNVPAAEKLISLIIQLEGIEDERAVIRPLSDNDQAILDRMLGADGASDEDEPTSDNSQGDDPRPASEEERSSD
jgi:hypothetical protein